MPGGAESRTHTVQVGASLQHAVLEALAPGAADTAAALAAAPSSKEAQRVLVANTPLAASIITSFLAACERKETWAVKAQLLSPRVRVREGARRTGWVRRSCSTPHLWGVVVR